MTVPAPSNLAYGKVVWQSVSDIVDGSDPDVTPDFIAPTGTVTFVASMVVGRDIAASPNPVTVVRDPIPGILDDEGYLCTPDPDDPALPGERGVWLIATDDPDMNPTGWVYNVTYEIRGKDGRKIALKSHQIYVPTYVTEADAVDLTVVGPVDNAQTIGIPAAEAAAASARASAAEARQAADDAAAALTTLDPTTAGLVADGDSLTGAAFAAKMGTEVEDDASPLRIGLDPVVHDMASLHGDGIRSRLFGEPQPTHPDYTYPNLLTWQELEDPPGATAAPSKGVDIIGHWYNDEGLDAVALSATSANGWYGWYDRRWNRPTNTGDGVTSVGYDPQRDPLLGPYKGDDPTTLGWQCQWLTEAGVNVVSLASAKGHQETGWDAPSHLDYWIHQLFENVPNFSALRYVLWMPRGLGAPLSDSTGYFDQLEQIVARYAATPNGYSYTENGKTYAVVFCWDLASTRVFLDGSTGGVRTNTVAMLNGLGDAFKAIGYDGVMVLARNGGEVLANPSSSYTAHGVVVADADYEERYGTDASYGNDYEQYADTAPFPTGSDAVLNVVTSAKTAYPHTSGWTLAGSTPAAFAKVLARAVDHIVKFRMRRMITVYNVAEWAEGGPGLQPNMQDGFGYLDAVRALPAIPSSVSGGSSAEAGTILAQRWSNPTSGDSIFTTSGASLVDVHSTWQVTFTAPKSGSVLVLLNAVAYSTTDATVAVWWGLRSGGATVTGSEQRMTQGTNRQRCQAEILIQDLTPGQSYTYTWAHRAGGSSQVAAHGTGPNFGGGSIRIVAA